MQRQQQEPVAEVVRARKFELVDKKGSTRAAIEVYADLAGIVLVGAEGKHRVGLWLSEEGTPSIGLKDAQGRMAFMLALGHGETRLLTMADKEGHVRLALSLSPDGAAEIHMTSQEGKFRRITATSAELTEAAGEVEQPQIWGVSARGTEHREGEEPQEQGAA